MLALVVDAVDRDPHGSYRLLDIPQPLAVALSPYSPYTLRMAREAVTRHKEVLARVEPDTTPTEALEAVPHATGVLFEAPPKGEPDAEAAALRGQGIYVVDAAGLPAAWTRALRDARVPRVRAIRAAASGPAGDLRAFRARAVHEGAGVLVVDADAPITPEALDSLSVAATHGFRPAFVAEVVQAARSATDAP